MNRSLAFASALAFVLAANASSADAQKHKRPRTLKGLVHHVVGTLAAGDVKAFLLLAPTLAEMHKHCPGMPLPPKAVAKLRKKMTRAFHGCRKAIDWKRAQIVSFTGGKKSKEVRECTGVWRLRDIEVKLQVGSRTRTLTIDDPFVLNGVSFGTTELRGCLGGGTTTAKPPPRPAAPKAPKAP